MVAAIVITKPVPGSVLEEIAAGAEGVASRDLQCLMVVDVATRALCPGIMPEPRVGELLVCPVCGQHYLLRVVSEEQAEAESAAAAAAAEGAEHRRRRWEQWEPGVN